MARLFSSVHELEQAAAPIIGTLSSPSLLDEHALKETLIDDLIYTAMFSTDETLTNTAVTLISQLSLLSNVLPSSIRPLYTAFGLGSVDGFTVPALNLRALTYDTARMVFRLMQEKNIGAVIFEIARSEIEYTHQRPAEYSAAILAAAIKEGYQGRVFLQGDHYQISKTKYSEDSTAEIERIKALIKESIDASFYNIDIDASTLVDLSKTSITDQQSENSSVTALLTNYIRSLQPTNVAISIGGEIGHIGDKNSSVEDFTAFMDQFSRRIPTDGISKVSVQTGSSHGGTVLPDGSIKQVEIDFTVLRSISTLAREKYHLGGAVQHGASTLPLSAFDHFVENKTLEVHLATGLQNTLFDTLPQDLKTEITTWISDNLSTERVEGQTDEQFIYQNRKKALGPFKQLIWDLSNDEKAPILQALELQLTTIFDKLHVFQTKQVVAAAFK